MTLMVDHPKLDPILQTYLSQAKDTDRWDVRIQVAVPEVAAAVKRGRSGKASAKARWDFIVHSLGQAPFNSAHLASALMGCGLACVSRETVTMTNQSGLNMAAFSPEYGVIVQAVSSASLRKVLALDVVGTVTCLATRNNWRTIQEIKGVKIPQGYNAALSGERAVFPP